MLKSRASAHAHTHTHSPMCSPTHSQRLPAIPNVLTHPLTDSPICSPTNLNYTIREHMVVPVEANHALTILYLLFLSQKRCGMEARCTHKEVSFKAFDVSLVFRIPEFRIQQTRELVSVSLQSVVIY